MEPPSAAPAPPLAFSNSGRPTISTRAVYRETSEEQEPTFNSFFDGVLDRRLKYGAVSPDSDNLAELALKFRGGAFVGGARGFANDGRKGYHKVVLVTGLGLLRDLCSGVTVSNGTPTRNKFESEGTAAAMAATVLCSSSGTGAGVVGAHHWLDR